MLQYLKSRWELLIVLIFFIALKLPALHYPFYWDESWSYAPGVKLMYLHGPSLMPNAIDLFYSRGHPLLFYAAAAAWMKLFGDSHLAQHAFALLLSVCLLVSIYEVALRIFNKRVAVISLLLMPLQVIFYVQATFLLPEVMIALLSVLTLFFFVTEKYLPTFLCCTALMLTKESGLVMGGVLGICAAFDLLNKQQPLPARLKALAAVLCSGLIIGAFFLLQKKLNGWYFYPEHTGYIQLEKHIFWNKFIYALDTLFDHDYRLRMFGILLMLALIVAIPIKDLRYATPLLPAYLIYVTIENKFHWLPRKAMFALLALSFLFTAWQLLSLSEEKSRIKSKFVYLTTIFIITYLAFSCVNFFSARYLICIMALLFILVAAYFDVYISKLYDLIYYLTLASIALTGFYAFRYNDGLMDKNLGAFDAMKVQEDMITFFEQANCYDKQIATSNFLNTEHLQKPLTGFLHTGKTFQNVHYDITPATDYVIIDNIKIDPKEANLMYDTVPTSHAFHLAWRTAKGPAWAEVYERVR